MRTPIPLTGLIAAVALLAGSSALCAQEQAPPAAPAPYRGIFGGAWTDPAYRKTLDLSMSLVQTFDDHLLIDTLGMAPITQVGGSYSGLTGNVEFQARGDRIQTRVAGGSNLRIYPSLQQTLVATHFEGAGLAVHLPRRTTLTVNETAVYSPSIFYGMFANAAAPALGALITPAPEYAMSAQRSYAYAADARVSKDIGRRGTVSLNADLQRSDAIGRAPQVFNVNSNGFGGQFTYSLTRNAALRFGYQARDVMLPATGRFKERNIDIGVDYQRPLSRSRRTTLAFSAATTSFTGPVINAPPNTFAQQYGLSADATLAHQFGRTWNVRGTYHRGMNAIQGFEAPLFMDAVSATAVGFVNRRSDFSGSASYSTGNSVFVTTRSRVVTYTGNLRLRVALTRTWATSVEYLYYFYDFDRTLQLPPGVTPRYERNSLSVGLTWWTPAWRRR